VSAVDDLIAFLRARLDEEAAEAQSVQGDQLFDGTGIIVMQTHASGGRSVTLPSHVAGFAARWNPARVLAEVEAKRQILAWIDRVAISGQVTWSFDADAPIRLLALPYADHPDYREEWRPEV
jgi:hypothetical protein